MGTDETDTREHYNINFYNHNPIIIVDCRLFLGHPVELWLTRPWVGAGWSKRREKPRLLTACFEQLTCVFSANNSHIQWIVTKVIIRKNVYDGDE